MTTDVHDPKTRSYNMSRIRGRNTKPEVRLRSLLHHAGLRFRIHKADLPGKPDIVLTKYKAVVFVNGCFWHRHEGCRYCTTPKTRANFWDKKFSDTIERDRLKHEQLEQAGWRVFIVWECELRGDAERTTARLIEQIKQKE
jgi:DNA mismatch endonuclease, patch repair protein